MTTWLEAMPPGETMTTTSRPVYLLAGGRGQRRPTPDPLLQAVFRGCGVPSPSIAYVGTASGDDRSFFGFITAAFREAGAGEIKHALIAPARADLRKARNTLEAADIIFISGGDVEAGMDILNEKDMSGFLSGLHRQGKPFFGISAGSIMLAREWVRWRDPDNDATAEIFPCLGIAPVICDTHAEGDDWDELKALLALEPDNTEGYGIPSGAAIKVYPDGRVEALGDAVPRYLRRGERVMKAGEVRPA
jgi:peptidase E